MKQDRSLYYADDKDIADVLASAKKRFPGARLVELARRRGIILSENTNRDELVEYISMLGFDWPQLRELLQMIESSARAPKEMTTHITTSATFAQVVTVLTEVGKRRENRRERYVPTSNGRDLITLKVEYSEFDEAWTRLRQQIDRDMEIRVEYVTGALAVRHPAQALAEDIVETVRLLLEEKLNEPTKIRTLSLSGLGVKDRTEFFLELFKLPGFRLSDVVRVRVARPAYDRVKLNLSREEDEEDEGEGSDEDKSVEGLVRQVTLEGKQLTATREYQELIERGVCINRAIWRVDTDPTGGAGFELMAGFGNASAATRFHYAVRAVWDVNKNSGELNKNSRSPQETERTKMAKLLEDYAQKAAQKVLDRATLSSESSSVASLSKPAGEALK